MSDVIFTPVFKGTEYQHHVCSECGGEIQVGQSIFGGLYFDHTEEIKFCPLCGGHVVRFEKKAIYIESIDYSPLGPFFALRREFEDKAKWLFWCMLTEAQRNEISAVLPFTKSDECPMAAKAAGKIVEDAERYRPSWQTKEKLKRRFGQEVNDD